MEKIHLFILLYLLFLLLSFTTALGCKFTFGTGFYPIFGGLVLFVNFLAILTFYWEFR